MLLKQISGVTAFLEGLVVYVLSREWHDMLSIYVFRLQPVPHCSEAVGVRFGFFGLVKLSQHSKHFDNGPTCTQEADSATQARCVLMLIAVAAVIQGIARRTLPAELATIVTQIAGTTIGWTAGDAAVRLLAETMPPADENGQEGGYDLVFAMLTTVVAVVLMLLLEPFTVHAIAALIQRALEPCCGACAGAWRAIEAAIDWLEDALLALAMLTGRAVTMVVLMIWVYVSQLNLLAGLDADQLGGPLQIRLQLLWATTLSLTSALVLEQVIRWRQQLERYADELASHDEREHDRGVANAPAAASRLSTPAGGNVLLAWGDGLELTLNTALRRVLSLSEQALFFATGWSWTYVFFPLTSKAPSVVLAVTDLTLALSLTLLAVTLIVLLPGERLAQNRSGRISFNGMESLDVTGGARMAIVKATLTTSSTFFVGWSFVVFFRDLAAVTGQGAVQMSTGDVQGLKDVTDTVSIALSTAVSTTAAVAVAVPDAQVVAEEEEDLVAFAGALGGVLFFGPVLSVAVLGAKHLLFAKLQAMSGDASIEEASRRLQRAAVRAKLARLGVLQPAAKGDPALAA